jgi:hypothetical protein
MRTVRTSVISGLLLAAVVLTRAAAPAVQGQVILSNNLSATTAGTETASGTTWLTASFGTGSTSYTLNSVTLLLANTTAGQASLSLYSDGTLEPGTALGTLTAPASYSGALANTTFAASGLTLAANTTYWVVLRATSGAIDWAWTSDNTGTGVGFQHTWGSSDDAGSTWFTFDTFPTQFSITATPVPEPGSLALVGVGAVGLLLRRRRRTRLGGRRSGGRRQRSTWAALRGKGTPQSLPRRPIAFQVSRPSAVSGGRSSRRGRGGPAVVRGMNDRRRCTRPRLGSRRPYPAAGRGHREEEAARLTPRGRTVAGPAGRPDS